MMSPIRNSFYYFQPWSRGGWHRSITP